MSDYQTLFKKIEDLTESDRKQITGLYLAYFDSSSEQQVISDLEKKTEILLVYFEEALVGFSTLELYDFEWENSLIQILYSGDTIVDQAHWGQQALAFAWIANLGKLKRDRPDVPLYWFVILKGHRTFKFLPAFGKSFYPHWSIDRSDLKPLVDALAKQKFGSDYNPETGIVEFAESRGHLNPDIAYPTESEKTRDSVRFFLKKNPNYLRGHELVCLCEISEQNMKPLTKRIFCRSGV
jgi:hypothetical protein